MEPVLSPRGPSQPPTSGTASSGLASSTGSSVASSPRESDPRSEQRLKELQQAVARNDTARKSAILPKKTINLDKVLDPSRKRIKEVRCNSLALDSTLQDIVRIIVQYLRGEGYSTSAVTLQDEANVRLMEDHAYQSTIKKLKKAILEVERLAAKPSFRNQQSFLYAIYRQQYLELIERQEYQKAFTYLQKKLKPLEAHQTYAGEFRDLCYLLTCKSVQDIPGLKWWDGEKGSSREKLIEQFQSMLEIEALETSGAQAYVPDARLLTLLRQAAAYQIEFSRYKPRASPSLNSLLSDYACYVQPNSPKSTLGGHKGNVKCVEFVGEEGNLVASGASDNTVRLWSAEDGRCTRVLSGHTSRVWGVASAKAGNLLVTASGDATAAIYDIKGESTQPKLRLTGHEADVYSVALHPAEVHVATAGYDRSVRLFDITTGKLLKTFAGHASSVATVVFNPYGNLIISGSKDSTIKFWDVTSGLCVRTFSSYLGEVTSLQTNSNGSQLLSGSKDNSNRLWDLKMGKPIKRFKGHQNTSKNFIYGSLQSVVISGSEDGVVYAWDADAGAVVERLTGHIGPVYSVAWNERQALLASCGHDCTVRLWTYEEKPEEIAHYATTAIVPSSAASVTSVIAASAPAAVPVSNSSSSIFSPSNSTVTLPSVLDRIIAPSIASATVPLTSAGGIFSPSNSTVALSSTPLSDKGAAAAAVTSPETSSVPLRTSAPMLPHD